MQTPSAASAVERFGTSEAAAKYSRSLVGTGSHRREERCIRKALRGVPAGARVLDLPCGTGRLLPLLASSGFVITAADSSAHMIEHARQAAEEAGLDLPAERFHVCNVFSTGFDDAEFDAVLCNRLFHHFFEPKARVAALRELARISAGPIVVSFFCRLAWDALTFRVRNAILRRHPTDRVPIGYGTFAREIASAGLTIERVLPTRPGLSKQWYLRLSRAG